MRHDVSTDRFGGIAKEGIGFGHHLVGDVHDKIVTVSEFHQHVHVLVDLLLAISEGSSSNIFCSEMRC